MRFYNMPLTITLDRLEIINQKNLFIIVFSRNIIHNTIYKYNVSIYFTIVGVTK